MTRVVDKSVSQAFETWRGLCDQLAERRRVCDVQSQRWREGAGPWSDCEAARRQYDIVHARMSVAWAHYIVLKHGLNKSEVFDFD
ncbi:hypothetical protein [Prauserella muralis]|nr:hypothetical protein [Prauserella muralis]TWE29773.1 hypothetical protein FHX69_2462 [Prauserella muralis]